MVAPFLKPLKAWIAAQKKLDAKKGSSAQHLAPTIQTEDLMTEEEPATENEGVEVKGNLMALLGLSKKAEEPSNLPEVSDVEVSMKDTSARLKRLLSVSGSPPTYGSVSNKVSGLDVSKSNDLLALLQKGPGPTNSGEPQPSIVPQPPSELSNRLTQSQSPLSSNLPAPFSFPIPSSHPSYPQLGNSFVTPFTQSSLQTQPLNLDHKQHYHHMPRPFPPHSSYFQQQAPHMPSFVPTQQPFFDSLPARAPTALHTDLIPQHGGPQRFPRPLPYPQQQAYEINHAPEGLQFSRDQPQTTPQGHGMLPTRLNSHSQALLNVLKHGNATELSATPSASTSSPAGQWQRHGSNGAVSPVLNASPAGASGPRNEHQNALLDLFRSPPTGTAVPSQSLPVTKNPPAELSAHLSPGIPVQGFSDDVPPNQMTDGIKQPQAPVQQGHESSSPLQLRPVASALPPTKMSVPSTRPRFEGPTRKSKGKKTTDAGRADQRSETPTTLMGTRGASGGSQTNGVHSASNLTSIPFETETSQTTPQQEGQENPKGITPAPFQPQILRRPTHPLPKAPPAFDRRSSQSAQQTQALLSLFGKPSTPIASPLASTTPTITTSPPGGTEASIRPFSDGKRVAGPAVKSPVSVRPQMSPKKSSSISDVNKGFLLGYLEDVAKSSRRY
jgi:mRNA-decapping enzyme subunit 2